MAGETEVHLPRPGTADRWTRKCRDKYTIIIILLYITRVSRVIKNVEPIFV